MGQQALALPSLHTSFPNFSQGVPPPANSQPSAFTHTMPQTLTSFGYANTPVMFSKAAPVAVQASAISATGLTSPIFASPYANEGRVAALQESQQQPFTMIPVAASHATNHAFTKF